MTRPEETTRRTEALGAELEGRSAGEQIAVLTMRMAEALAQIEDLQAEIFRLRAMLPVVRPDGFYWVHNGGWEVAKWEQEFGWHFAGHELRFEDASMAEIGEQVTRDD